MLYMFDREEGNRRDRKYGRKENIFLLCCLVRRKKRK